MISLLSGFSSVGEEFGVFVGRQSVILGRSGLCSVVSSVGEYGKYVDDVVDFVCYVYLYLECILLDRRYSGVEFG